MTKTELMTKGDLVLMEVTNQGQQPVYEIHLRTTIKLSQFSTPEQALENILKPNQETKTQLEYYAQETMN